MKSKAICEINKVGYTKFTDKHKAFKYKVNFSMYLNALPREFGEKIYN